MADDRDDAALLEAVRQTALTTARRQSALVAAQAEDIAMAVVEKFLVASREGRIEEPLGWARSTAHWMSTDLAKRQKAQRDHEESTDSENASDPVDVNPYGYPLRHVAGADSVDHALSCLSDRERQLVMLVDEGYSHAEIAQIMGYSGARSVTTTLNRIRDKVDTHLGGEEGRRLLLDPVFAAMELRIDWAEDDPDEASPGPADDSAPSVDEADPELYFRKTL